MRRLVLGLCALVLAAGSGVAIAATPSGSDAAQQCYDGAAAAPDPHFALPCKFAESSVNQAGAECRILDKSDDQCSAIDGRNISEAEISAYQSSWTHRALSLQRNLTAQAPLVQEQLPHTHNSFNASAYNVPTDGSSPSYYPTLTNQDPNQVYSLTDQLDMDVRVIELDLHWVPSVYAPKDGSTHGYWVTLCHGDGEQVPDQSTYVHVGCSDDRPAEDGFAEVRRWINTHPDQFVYVYLENQIYPQQPVATQEQGVDVAAKLLDKAFGDVAYKPAGTRPNGSCADIPYDTSTAQMLATGKHLLLLGNCGTNSAASVASKLPTWSGLVFQRGDRWNESGDPANYSASNCAQDQSLRAAGRTFHREFEDSTFVTAATGSGPHALMTPNDVATMTRCGVNIIGFDQLRPQDGRLTASVWSWASNEPSSSGQCAAQGTDGRFRATSCTQQLPAACETGDGRWHVTPGALTWRDAADACAADFPGSSFSVPLNGYSNDQLRQSRNGGGAVWLDYAKVGGTWTPFATPDRDGRDDQHVPHGHAYGWHHGRGPADPKTPRNASLD